jgi:hypothetical protein
VVKEIDSNYLLSITVRCAGSNPAGSVLAIAFCLFAGYSGAP